MPMLSELVVDVRRDRHAGVERGTALARDFATVFAADLAGVFVAVFLAGVTTQALGWLCS